MNAITSVRAIWTLVEREADPTALERMLMDDFVPGRQARLHAANR